MPVHIVSDDIRALGGFWQVPRFVGRLQPCLSHGAIYLYGILLTLGWDDDRGIGQTELAVELGVNERQVRNLLGELRKRGLVEVTRQGLGKPNRYSVLIPDSAGMDRQFPAGPDRRLPADPSILVRYKDISNSKPTGNKVHSSEGEDQSNTNKGKSRKTQERKSSGEENWVARFGDKLAMHAGGSPTYGQVGKLLKPLHQALGEDELWRRWANFCEHCDSRYLYASYFAKNTAKWIPRPAQHPGQPARPNGVARPTDPRFRPPDPADDPYAGMTAKEKFYAKHGDRIQR